MVGEGWTQVAAEAQCKGLEKKAGGEVGRRGRWRAEQADEGREEIFPVA